MMLIYIYTYKIKSFEKIIYCILPTFKSTTVIVQLYLTRQFTVINY